MTRHTLLLGAVLAAVMLPASFAAAQEDETATAEAIKARIANFREIGTAFKTFDDEFKSGKPYLPAMQIAAGQIVSLGQDIPKWFPPGSVPAAGAAQGGFIAKIKALIGGGGGQTVAGVKTKALGEVAAKPDEFKKDWEAFMVEANKMNEIAKGGDLEAVKAQFKPLGDSCGACHKGFRLEE
jgi:cytochrome c556